MIINFFIKNFRTIIDALIVAAIIIVLALWDPFGWFGRSTKIKDTPVSLRSVKEIGQLVTAEYYGEVVASLKESMIMDFSDTVVQNQVNTLFGNMLSAVIALKEEDVENRARWINLEGRVKRSNIDRKFGNRYPQITGNYLYYLMIDFLSDTLSASADLPSSSEKEPQVLWHYFQMNDENLKAQIPGEHGQTGLLNNFRKHYLTYRADSVHQKRIKKEIIYIGRGWVKAGIDFGNFDEARFWYDRSNKTIYFRNLEPKILDADINPWYIPEEKIKGFELVVATGRIKAPFEESKKVKLLCKEKLRLQALQSDILQQARENARSSLRRLFSLLMDEEIREVIFTSNKYRYILNEVAADSLITENEALMLDSLITTDEKFTDTAWYNNHAIQLEELKWFCSALKKVKFVITGTNYNYFSPMLARITQDGILKAPNIEMLNTENRLYKDHSRRFQLKKQLFGIHTSINPEYKDIYNFLESDSHAVQYLELDADSLFSTEMKTQYLLSNCRKREFKQLALDSIESKLSQDQVYPLLFWFHDTTGWKNQLLRFNLDVFQTVDSISPGVDSVAVYFPIAEEPH